MYVLMIALVAIVFNGCKKDDTTSLSSTKKDPIITWANPADITAGTLLSATQLNATADVPGTFVYLPAIGESLAVGANQDLKVSFAPTDVSNYNTTSKTVKINVTAKKDPVITWANPADISFGTLLSATQLNAVADVPGTFVYTPIIGTKLNVGDNQELKVDFTPTVATYNTATKTVKINVKAMPTVTDYDGNVYTTVMIGTHTWTVENLKVTHYRNGDPIPNVTSNTAWTNLTTGAYCWYNNDNANKTPYGALYNWFTVSDSRNIAPEGWHVPTDAEWTTLTTYLGGESVAGGKMKEAGTTHWTSPNASATNENGFTALPSGYRGGYSGTFYDLGDNGYWWSSTANGATNAWYRSMNYYNADCYRYYGNEQNWFAVRLIKD